MTRVRKLARGEKPGTTVRWRHDESIFEKGAHYSASTIGARLKEKSYLVRGLTFRFHAAGHDEQVFRTERGLADYVRDLERRAPAPMHPTIISLIGTGGEIPVEVALQWTQTAEERMYSFCNVVNTVDGGTHVSGLRARADPRAEQPRARDGPAEARARASRFEARDVFEGLTAAVSVMLADPQFEGQTKGRLNNSEAQGAVQSFAYARVSAGCAERRTPKETKQILDRLLLTRDIRLAAVQDLEEAPQRGDVDLLRLEPARQARRHARQPERARAERELFIVEGDSAGGSAKGARDANLQAILPLRGKILNVLGATGGRRLRERRGRLDPGRAGRAQGRDRQGHGRDAGGGPAALRQGDRCSPTPTPTARTSRNLLITLFHELFPRLLAEGRVFLAQPPLFRIVARATARTSTSATEEELRQSLQGARAAPAST